MFEFRFLVQNGAVCHITIEQPRETSDGFVTDVRNKYIEQTINKIVKFYKFLYFNSIFKKIGLGIK